MVLGWRLKMAVIVNYMFRPQKTLKKRRRQLYSTLAFQVCYTVVKIGPLKRTARKITATEMKYMRKTTGYT